MTKAKEPKRTGYNREPKPPPICEHLRVLEEFMRALQIEFFLSVEEGVAQLGCACGPCERNRILETSEG